MRNTIVVWRDKLDGDTVHFGAKRLCKPEVYGPLCISLSIHIDPLFDLVGQDATAAIKALKPGEMADVQIALVVRAKENPND
jgi:hypothetical protein